MSGIENELLFNCSFFLPISVFFTRCLKDSNAFFPWRKAFHLNTENEKKTHSAYSLAFQKRFDSFLIKEFIMKKGLCFVLLMLGTANAIERKRQPSEEENLRKRTIDSAFFAEVSIHLRGNNKLIYQLMMLTSLFSVTNRSLKKKIASPFATLRVDRCR